MFTPTDQSDSFEAVNVDSGHFEDEAISKVESMVSQQKMVSNPLARYPIHKDPIMSQPLDMMHFIQQLSVIFG
jgi:hypothetical protein